MLPKLSQDWKTRPLSEICTLIMGQAPKGESYNDKGIGKPLIAGAADLGPITPMPKKWTTAPTKLGKKGDIILCVRATIGNLNWADLEYCYGRGVSAIRATLHVDPHFIWFWLEACKDHLMKLGRGATFKQISKSDIAGLRVPYLDLIEQRRIVARIKECMERVEEIENNSTIIDDELAALFPAMLHEKFTEFAEDVLVERLENVTDIKGGGSLPRGSAQDTGKDAVLLVKVGDMNAPGNERIIQVSRAYIPISKAGNKVIDSGAVIFPKRGGAIATNKKRMLGRPAMIDPNLMAVIAKTGRVLSEYLYYWTLTLDLTDISNGGVIPQLNRKDLAPLEIPVPEIKTQALIVSELEQAEAFCSEQRTLFDSVNQERQMLRESILSKAFAGEL